MSKITNLIRHSGTQGGIATIVLGAVLLAFSLTASAEPPDYSEYDGSASCKLCHEENFNDWYRSGHPYKLMKTEQAQFRPIPLPEGAEWEDFSYVIGGYKWKSRYVQNDGYIYTPSDGGNQYNYLTDTWNDYHPGEVRPYNCGDCHTTGWIPDLDFATDGDLTDNQEEMEGMHGTFYAGGIHCEECHGPGGLGSPNGMQIDTDRPEGITDPTEMTGAFCGRCHMRYDSSTFMPPEDESYIPASGGFIRHHEQYNEFLASPHRDAMGGTMDCNTCHNPHKRGEFSIWQDGDAHGDPEITTGAVCGVNCHASKMESFSKTSMYDYGVECKDCHMPYASKSAQALGPVIDGLQTKGDLQTHIMWINTDPTASMFEEGGGRVALDDNGMGAVTMNFACQRCHETASLDELALYAKDFHDPEKSLEDIGLDPGLSGTWIVAGRSGEGWLLEVGYAAGELFLFVTFYTYDGMGEQAYLIAQSTAIDGNTAEVIVYMTNGAVWGDDFNPDDVNRPLFGTGTVTFSTCGAGHVEITANAEMVALGFSDVTADLSRALTSGIACPTFVNNAMTATGQ
jgi:hypothetical protein